MYFNFQSNLYGYDSSQRESSMEYKRVILLEMECKRVKLLKMECKRLQ